MNHELPTPLAGTGIADTKKRLEERRAQLREQFIRDNFLSDEMIDFFSENMAPFDEMLSYYKCAIMEVETKFRVLDEQFSLQYDRNPIESIKTRVKSTNSLMKKIHKRGIPLSLKAIEQNITDIAGVRVICSFPADIYMLAECLIRQDDVHLVEMKDYIKNPKPSGYRSLHLIVEVPIFLKNEKRNMKVEVQLRTIAMDFWASVEHKLRYKKNIPDDLAQELSDELLECANISANLDLRMQAVRDRLQAEADAEEKTGHENGEKSGTDGKTESPLMRRMKTHRLISE